MPAHTRRLPGRAPRVTRGEAPPSEAPPSEVPRRRARCRRARSRRARGRRASEAPKSEAPKSEVPTPASTDAGEGGADEEGAGERGAGERGAAVGRQVERGHPANAARTYQQSRRGCVVGTGRRPSILSGRASLSGTGRARLAWEGVGGSLGSRKRAQSPAVALDHGNSLLLLLIAKPRRPSARAGRSS